MLTTYMYEQTQNVDKQPEKQQNIICAKCCSTYSSVYTNTYSLLLDWHGMSCCIDT
jgi:hypothetical protein